METNMYQSIEFSIDGDVAYIQLDRPESLNALNSELLTEFEEALKRAENSEGVRAVVVRGNGDAFSSGYDIGTTDEDQNLDQQLLDQRTHLETIFSLKLPVIAAVDGHALAGGCNLAIACDLTFATESSTFGYPDMHFGEPPPKFVLPFVTNSLKHARELLYSGKMIPASKAKEMGLVNDVVADGTIDARVEEELDEIRKTPSLAVALSKDMINSVQEAHGFRRYGRIDEYIGALTMETETPNRFREIRDEKGLQAALEWTHETDKS